MYQLQKSSRLDNNEMTRLLLRTLVGTCLVSLCYGTALFAIAWRDVQNGVHVVLESTQRSIAGWLNGNSHTWPMAIAVGRKTRMDIQRVRAGTEEIN
jgi:hypothetical protein